MHSKRNSWQQANSGKERARDHRGWKRRWLGDRNTFQQFHNFTWGQALLETQNQFISSWQWIKLTGLLVSSNSNEKKSEPETNWVQDKARWYGTLLGKIILGNSIKFQNLTEAWWPSRTAESQGTSVAVKILQMTGQNNWFFTLLMEHSREGFRMVLSAMKFSMGHADFLFFFPLSVRMGEQMAGALEERE